MAYAGEGLPTRLHVVVRALTCPFQPLMDRFPTAGALLDVGCGHGLLVNLLARDPSRRRLKLHGIDHECRILCGRRSGDTGPEAQEERMPWRGVQQQRLGKRAGAIAAPEERGPLRARIQPR